MFDIIHKKRPQAGENTNERFPSDMLSRDPHVCTSTKFALVRDQIVLLKYQISGLGVTHAARERRSGAKKTREKERKAVGCCSTHKRARGREKREKECAVLIMKKSSGSSFQNLQGTNKLRLVKEWCRCCSSSKKRKHNCASPSDDNLFYDWGFVFFFVFFFVCAVFCSRLFAFARKQRK